MMTGLNQIVVNWLELKTFVDARSLSIQEVEETNQYILSAVRFPNVLITYIKKGGAEATEYETNYRYYSDLTNDDYETRIDWISVPGRIIYGRTAKLGALETDAVWQMWSIDNKGTSREHTHFAQSASKPNPKFIHKWSDRLTIFPAIQRVNDLALHFDGINDHLNGGDIFKFDIATAFSFSLWVKAQNISQTRILFAKAGAAPDVKGYMTRYNATTGNLFSQMRTGTTNVNHTWDSAIVAGQYMHLVYTFSGNSNKNGQKLYLGGVLDTNLPGSSALSGSMLEGQDFTVGSRSGSFFHSGEIDEMTVWSKELNQDDVDELRPNGKPMEDPNQHSAASFLISEYRMGDDDSHPQVSDKKGSNHLQMINFTEGNDSFVEDVP